MDRTVKFAIIGACAAIVLLVLYVIFAPVIQRWQMERQLEQQLEQMFGNVQEQAEQHTRTGIRT